MGKSKSTALDITIDGRAARATRTREAIADAVLSLLEEGHLRPTAPEVAERARVSLRSVFQHFADMEALFAAVSERQMEAVLSQARYVPGDGPLSGRIQAFIVERTRLHDLITPVRRVGHLHEPFSQIIAERLQWSRERARDEIAAVFEVELRRLPSPVRREVLDALTAAGSWSTWESLRSHQQLSAAAARKVVQRMFDSILNAAVEAS